MGGLGYYVMNFFFIINILFFLFFFFFLCLAIEELRGCVCYGEYSHERQCCSWCHIQTRRRLAQNAKGLTSY